MPTLHTTIANSVKTLPQPAPRGEFLMSGNLTTFDDDPEPSGAASEPAAMPDYLSRKEVQLMLRKLRNSVSFWERIRSVNSNQARENSQHLALPQHNLFIK